MENKNFCVFILTHGRPYNVITYNTIKKCGYTGKVYFVIDNEDKRLESYQRKFGIDNVMIFDKKFYADNIDEGNNFDERRGILYARNACFDIAKKLDIKYFVQFDDDYTDFYYRFENKLGFTPKIKNLDKIFSIFLNFYINTNILTIAFSQGGDHIGGFSGMRLKRKAMNSFICSTDRPFNFIGVFNEDVNTYTTLGSRGDIFFTYTSIQLNQKPTQSQKGGITDLYKRFGTYCKSFTTVMMQPSSVKVYMMHTSNNRLHHSIKWINTVPMIIDDKYKK